KELGCEPIAAAGTAYTWNMFAKPLRDALQALPQPTDGEPALLSVHPLSGLLQLLAGPNAGAAVKMRPCGAGIGTRGGSSRGAGSGSRLLLYHCACAKPVKIRHSGRDLQATCNHCNSAFALVEDSVPHASGNGKGGPAKPGKGLRPAPVAS